MSSFDGSWSIRSACIPRQVRCDSSEVIRPRRRGESLEKRMATLLRLGAFLELLA
ncbi:hypothetical protein DPMN_016629 [Dreissena polymorpha]|uniref:Uncharacterized protein n=1 Tax=Dreissena polymorpha TaxID=45954 RepID=A0A9D4NDV4_DREPO|nr:hypothetical protein DPMN_016629 [Dreissena polymorpha]